MLQRLLPCYPPPLRQSDLWSIPDNPRSCIVDVEADLLEMLHIVRDGWHMVDIDMVSGNTTSINHPSGRIAEMKL